MMTTCGGPPHYLPGPDKRSPTSEGGMPAMSFSQGRELLGADKPQGSWDDLLPKPMMTSPSASGPPTSSPMGSGGHDRDPGGQERPLGGWEGHGPGGMPMNAKAEPSLSKERPHGTWEGHSVGGVPISPKSEPPPRMSALAEETRRRRISDCPQKTFFTHAEKVLLTRLVEKHRNGLFNSNIRNKAETWRQLAQIYNSQQGVFPREPKQLKKCWENMKCRGIISPILQGERPRIRRYPRPMMLKPRSTNYGPPTMVPIRSAIPQSSAALLSPASSLGMQAQDFPHMGSPRMNIVGQLRARAAGLISSARALNTMASLGMDVERQRAIIYSSAPSFVGMRLPFQAPSSQPSQHPHPHQGEGPMFGSMPPAAPPPPLVQASPSDTLPQGVQVVKIEPPDSDSPTTSPPLHQEMQAYSLPVSASGQLFSSFKSGHGSNSAYSSITQTSAHLGVSESGMQLPVVNPHFPSPPGPSGQSPPSPPSPAAMGGGESEEVEDEEEGDESQDMYSRDETLQNISVLKARLLRRKLECLEREHEARMRVLMLQEDYWRLHKDALSQQQLTTGSAALHDHPVDSMEVNGDA